MFRFPFLLMFAPNSGFRFILWILTKFNKQKNQQAKNKCWSVWTLNAQQPMLQHSNDK